MKKHYIIDGNNLIGKEPSLWNLQKNDAQGSREKLAFLVDRYLGSKKVTATLHFDGHVKQAIRVSKIRIEYSNNSSADKKIKTEINIYKNPKHIVLISSDHNLIDFAKVNSASYQRSEDFLREIKNSSAKDDELSKIKSIDNNEMKKLFGID